MYRDKLKAVALARYLDALALLDEGDEALALAPAGPRHPHDANSAPTMCPCGRHGHMHKRYHVTTFGCQMNEHDSERMKGMLRVAGLRGGARARARPT